MFHYIDLDKYSTWCFAYIGRLFQVQIYELEEHKIETWRGDCLLFEVKYVILTYCK